MKYFLHLDFNGIDRRHVPDAESKVLCLEEIDHLQCYDIAHAEWAFDGEYRDRATNCVPKNGNSLRDGAPFLVAKLIVKNGDYSLSQISLCNKPFVLKHIKGMIDKASWGSTVRSVDYVEWDTLCLKIGWDAAGNLAWMRASIHTQSLQDPVFVKNNRLAKISKEIESAVPLFSRQSDKRTQCIQVPNRTTSAPCAISDKICNETEIGRNAKMTNGRHAFEVAKSKMSGDSTDDWEWVPTPEQIISLKDIANARQWDRDWCLLESQCDALTPCIVSNILDCICPVGEVEPVDNNATLLRDTSRAALMIFRGNDDSLVKLQQARRALVQWGAEVEGKFLANKEEIPGDWLGVETLLFAWFLKTEREVLHSSKLLNDNNFVNASDKHRTGLVRSGHGFGVHLGRRGTGFGSRWGIGLGAGVALSAIPSYMYILGMDRAYRSFVNDTPIIIDDKHPVFREYYEHGEVSVVQATKDKISNAVTYIKNRVKAKRPQFKTAQSANTVPTNQNGKTQQSVPAGCKYPTRDCKCRCMCNDSVPAQSIFKNPFKSTDKDPYDDVKTPTPSSQEMTRLSDLVSEGLQTTTGSGSTGSKAFDNWLLKQTSSDVRNIKLLMQHNASIMKKHGFDDIKIPKDNDLIATVKSTNARGTQQQ